MNDNTLNEQELARRAEVIRRTEPERYARLWPDGHPEPEQAEEAPEQPVEAAESAVEDEPKAKPTKPRQRRRKGSTA